MMICGQGFMPIYEIKKQLELFGHQSDAR